MRASDADRDRTIAALRDATVAGRLTLDEFAGRVEKAELARMQGELEPLTADLPATGSAQAPLHHRAIGSRLERRGRWELAPRGVHVEVDGGGAFGTREVDLPDTGPVANAPRLRITTSGPFGTLRIRAA